MFFQAVAKEDSDEREQRVREYVCVLEREAKCVLN